MDRQNNDQQEQEQEQEQITNPTLSSSDSLFCSDETHEEDEDDESQPHHSCSDNITVTETLVSGFADQALFREEDELELELSTMLSKESEHGNTRVLGHILEPDPVVSEARREAVEWILQATSHHCFSAITAVLAVDYLDRFVLRFDGFRRDQKPWVTSLSAVACLSLAAKVEEIHVPLLLDLQVEGTSEFMFEAKTIQKMEVLVLSTLQWRMNPLTSLSFLHNICKRVGLKERVGSEFLRRCELTLLSLISDYRFTLYPPSAMATATVLHVVDNIVAPTVALEYEKQLMGILKIDKNNVEKCRRFVQESVSLSSYSRKRKLGGLTPGSPNGVIEAAFSSDGSTDSSITMSSSSSSVTSSPEPSSKKSKNTITTTKR